MNLIHVEKRFGESDFERWLHNQDPGIIRKELISAGKGWLRGGRFALVKKILYFLRSRGVAGSDLDEFEAYLLWLTGEKVKAIRFIRDAADRSPNDEITAVETAMVSIYREEFMMNPPEDSIVGCIKRNVYSAVQLSHPIEEFVNVFPGAPRREFRCWLNEKFLRRIDKGAGFNSDSMLRLAKKWIISDRFSYARVIIDNLKDREIFHPRIDFYDSVITEGLLGIEEALVVATKGANKWNWKPLREIVEMYREELKNG